MTVTLAGPATLELRVVGVPAPQGSKRAFNNPHTGRAQMKESGSERLAPWRQDVKQAALDAIAASGWTVPVTGVTVEVTFLIVRPKGHYGTGRNAAALKPTAPPYPIVKPDIDKLLRSTLDALKVAGCYTDDCTVTDVLARKRYADPDRPGAIIRVLATP